MKPQRSSAAVREEVEQRNDVPPHHSDTAERRSRTLAWGVAPLAALCGLATLDHVPFTDISLTVPYAAQGKGPLFDTLGQIDNTPVVEISGQDVDATAGSLNMTTVSVATHMSLAQALGRWIFESDTLIPIEHIIPPNVSAEDIQKLNEAAFVESESAATLAAMRYLDLPTKVKVAGLIDEGPAAGLLEKGDVLEAVDGQDFAKPQEVQDYIRSKTEGDEVSFTVKRGEETVEVPVTLGVNPEDPTMPIVGILMSSAPAAGFEVDYNLQDVGGPSAGMIFALAVIDKLSPGELNGGKNVAGTGTVTAEGTVGPIGGAEHKVAAAAEAGVELFLVPKDNCADIAHVDKGDMAVASVGTLQDAIEAMKQFSEGREFRTCEAS